ncbi:type VI secretion system baseplate subunit TssG [Thalassolituus sp. ST750PaO-4]|uniref:type VI secretion system baseplate subunit TssG n=2 Tax=unclassified Thalassolituus TaxID=2624967 RepID=UPI000C5D3F3C|nr:type VI secretion system baseplate subunit TssG [Thalassolituus sp. ST750PaO-4]MCA6061024.1 type VI secretion system baseplate subunit TssG [Thalassolituus sp. ST750PaO-4]PIQ40106.1 MAG: type VI secretion system baseplate subunit TssG [Thalassolituus sp. CG17_big_fil_post_rev_8_21_14_2_50_53_8]
MASAHWRTGHTVNSLLAQKNGTGWNFLQLVRLVLRLRRTADATSGKQPVSDNELLEILADNVRFRASLAADFPPWDVREVSLSEQGITAITLAHGGLMSPDGPLPAPFIEWLRDRSEQDDHAMLDFLELFNNRLMALRYLVHRSTRPTLMDAPAEVSDSGRLMQALAGRLAMNPEGDYDLGLTGLFANVRLSLPMVRQMLQCALGLPLLHMNALQGGWLRVDSQDHSRLGDSQSCRLGQGATLGKRVWDQHKATELVIGPLDWAEVQKLTPGGARHSRLIDLIRRITDCRIDCRITLRCPANQLPSLRLSSKVAPGEHMALGVTSFLSHKPQSQGFRDISFMVGVAA